MATAHVGAMRALNTFVSSTVIVLMAVLLGSCTEFDIFIEAASDEGTVYECRTDQGKDVEYCYFDDSAKELSEFVGGTCGAPSRKWPKVVNFLNMGCVYSCPAPGKGCNAKQSCYCPNGDYPTK